MLTLTQVAKKLRLTRQAVYVAVRKTKKMKAEKVGKIWMVSEEELKNYKDKKYNRKHSYFDGKPLYDTEKGEISIVDAAKECGVTPQRIYYLLRIGKIPFFRRKVAYILNIKDVIEFFKNNKKRGQFFGR